MSETQEAAAPAVVEEARYGDPVAKSESNTAANPDSPPPDKPAEPAAKPANPAEPDLSKLPFNEGSYQARIRQQSARLSESARREEGYERQIADYKARYEPPQDGQQPAQQPRTQADYDRQVNEAADKLADERAFTKACNGIADAGAAEFKGDFVPTLDSLWDMTDGRDAKGMLTPRAVSLIEAAMETDKPAALLHHLGKTPADAVRIAAMTPAKMGAAVANLSASLAAEAAAIKVTSKAPAPPETVSGSARSVRSLEDMPMDEYTKAREAQIKANKAR